MFGTFDFVFLVPETILLTMALRQIRAIEKGGVA